MENMEGFKAKNVNSETSIKAVSKIFEEKNIKFIVVSQDENLMGIVTQNELLEAYFSGIPLNTGVKNITNNNIAFANHNYKLDEITNILEEDSNRYIIVLSKSLKPKEVITREVVINYFYKEAKKKIQEFKVEKNRTDEIKKEYTNDDYSIREYNIEGLINDLNQMNLWNKELNQIFEYSPNSFAVLDGTGVTLRVNKAFENITDIKREEAIGIDVKKMEERGMYSPAVGSLVRKEKRKVSVIQKIKNDKEALVTGVPVFDDKGEIFRIITNAVDIKEVNTINQYYIKQKKENNTSKMSHDVKIIYESESMKNIIQLTNELKDIDSTILITGESGVGKGVIARYIHNNGIRKKGRLVEINCGAIPETLLESELLGYEAGAFTGAQKSGKRGLIELANNGTLFLDEIGEMSLQLQVKLLQVIQEKSIIRVGGTEPIDVDIRIIAATNKNLQEMVNKGKFRLDLFYRLNVIPINIPPLRERKSDILAMIKYFLGKYNEKYSKEVVMGKSLLDMMIQYDWLGNVRELENAIECLVVTNPSAIIEKDNDKSNIFNLKLFNNYSTHSNLSDNIMPLEEAKEELEKKLVKMAYSKYPSSYKVAKVLKISQTTASRKIRQYIENQ
ncbi:sigma-54-dependent Fis family transcriptional regulator [Alkaliphilus peptidifermentans]|nr:sigma-54-dependent Fis family transcriptional regulator [Alkaliphilus peptidifermentans]